MAIERVGYRRLYDSLGCSLAEQKELAIEFEMGEFRINVYLGPKPKFGITVSSSDKYFIPGEEATMLKAEYSKDATESAHPNTFFTEIFCSKEVEVPDELSKAFHDNDSTASSEVLNLDKQDSQQLKAAADLIAGVIGLRFHRQFVLEVINENFVAMKDDNDYASNFVSPAIEMLESVALNANGIDILSRLLKAVGKAPHKAQDIGSSALAWLLHAWTERETTSKFMALFIPIEIILASYSGNPDDEKDQQGRLSQIKDIITSHGGTEAKNLLNFFNQIADRQRPSLASRFAEMAKEAKIDGWEVDVQAFKRFNSIRNKLLHRGERDVQLTISLDNELQEESRQLEDIAERYVSWTFFRDGVVYQSRYRPVRNKREAV